MKELLSCDQVRSMLSGLFFHMIIVLKWSGRVYILQTNVMGKSRSKSMDLAFAY